MKKKYIQPMCIVIELYEDAIMLATSSIGATNAQYQTKSDDSAADGCGEQLSNKHCGWNSDQWSDD